MVRPGMVDIESTQGWLKNDGPESGVNSLERYHGPPVLDQPLRHLQPQSVWS